MTTITTISPKVASANPNVVGEQQWHMLKHDKILSQAIARVTAGTKRADVARHPRGAEPRRLTRQRASRHTPGCPSSSRPTTQSSH